MEQWEMQLNSFYSRFNEAENNKLALEKSKDMLVKAVENERVKFNLLNRQHELHVKALAVLNKISEDAVGESLRFIEDNLNDVLAKIFVNSPRKIRLVEDMERAGKIPVLNIELTAANGVKRSLQDDSGHGIKQLVSLLCTMCLICITGTRRFLVLDEVLTGLSRESRMAVNDILWSFSTIGFQFVIVEHGFIAKGAKVYQLYLDNDVSSVIDEYIEPNGVYLEARPESTKKVIESKTGKTEVTWQW